MCCTRNQCLAIAIGVLVFAFAVLIPAYQWLLNTHIYNNHEHPDGTPFPAGHDPTITYWGAIDHMFSHIEQWRLGILDPYAYIAQEEVDKDI